jgi:hypothetical protein
MLSTGKGTWGEVASLINKPEFDAVYVLTNQFGKDTFQSMPQKKIEVFSFDLKKDPNILAKDFQQALKGQLKFGDIAVNMCSGCGKEHMAMISALLKLGVGIRFVSTNQKGELVELSPHVDIDSGRML